MHSLDATILLPNLAQPTTKRSNDICTVNLGWSSTCLVQAEVLSREVTSWGRNKGWRTAFKQQLAAMTHLNHSQKLAVGRAMLQSLTLWQVCDLVILLLWSFVCIGRKG